MRAPKLRTAAPERNQTRPEAEQVVTGLLRSGFPLVVGSGGPPFHAREWPVLLPTAQDHGLAPLVYKSLQKLGLLDQAPPDIIAGLRSAYLRSNVANWRAFEQLAGLLDAFDQARIPLILLKGCAVGPTLYEDIALRPMTDLDILVPRADMARAEDLLRALGLEPRLDVAEGIRLRLFNTQHFVCSTTGRAPVDLHTHILGDPYWSERIDVEWFWRQSVEARVNERTAHVFSPGAQLLYLSAHLIYHHGGGRLIWSYDVARLLALHGEQINWDEIVDVSEQFGLTQALKEGLARVSEDWHIGVPSTVSARLAAILPGKVVRFLLSGLAAQQSQVLLLSFGLSGLEAGEKLRYFLRLLLPSRAYMRWRYKTGSALLMPARYVQRLATGLCKAWRLIALISKRPDAC